MRQPETVRASSAVRRSSGLLLLLCLIAALAGCGVPADGTTRAVASDDVPYGLLRPNDVKSSPTPTGPEVTVPQTYLLDPEEQLVPQPFEVSAEGMDVVVGSVLKALSAGPTEDQRAVGLSSALGPNTSLKLVDVKDGLARIALASQTGTPAADRLPLAVGQIVLSVTSVAGVDRVLLLQGDQVLEAPLPDGEQTSDPLTTSDYAQLVAPSATPTTKATPGTPSPSS